MPLIHWKPWLEPFEDLEKDLLDEFRGIMSSRKSAGFMPRVDVYEKDNNVVVEAELPGIDPEKVEVSVADNVLVLKGDSEHKTEVDEKGFYRKEVRRGSFYRQVSLPARVEGEKAEADYDKGVLKVTIPKLSEAKTNKKIEIRIKK